MRASSRAPLIVTAMAVHFKEENVREISALLLGPPGTPYALGFYEVSAHGTEDKITAGHTLY